MRSHRDRRDNVRMPIARSSSSSSVGAGADVDHAALLGAAVAAVLSLTITEGQWSSLNMCIGVLLLAVVLGFAPPTRPAGEVYRALGWFARCGVVGICAALTVAWPVQRLLIEMDDVCLHRSATFEQYDTCVAQEAKILAVGRRRPRHSAVRVGDCAVLLADRCRAC